MSSNSCMTFLGCQVPYCAVGISALNACHAQLECRVSQAVVV